jgi:hypothetical protein
MTPNTPPHVRAHYITCSIAATGSGWTHGARRRIIGEV